MKDPLASLIGIFKPVDSLEDAQRTQTFAEIRNAAIRHADRMAKITAWSEAEAIEERKEAFEKEAAEALERGKAAARELPDVVIPDPLPPHLKGQPLSTIKAMLRHKDD